MPRFAGGFAPRFLLASGLAAAPVFVAPAADPKPRKNAGEPNPAFLDAIPAPYRPAVAAVIRTPTISAKGSEKAFVARPAEYDFLVDHPDRAAVAWRRLDIPCVAITDLGNNRWAWTDDNGSELTWQVVAKFADGVVWLASGHVKAGPVLPVVPVQAVAVLRYPRTPLDGDPTAALFEPSVHVYAQTDSRAATTLLRIAGPAAPRMAEQGAEQLMLFFSGPARWAHEHPADAARLLAPAGGK